MAYHEKYRESDSQGPNLSTRPKRDVVTPLVSRGVSETIAAIATPPGYGSIGVVRISGPRVPYIAKLLIGSIPEPRVATLADFRASADELLDRGIAIYFPSPRSFTGEDVLELQGHGGPVILDLLLRRILELGARPARPGEFSERAFVNGKLDLAQAEAIADLISSTTEIAVRMANRTLRGDLSHRVECLLEGMVSLRTFIESAIDFPDEEIDRIAQSQLALDLQTLTSDAMSLLSSARQGQLIREGIKLIIVGPPNAGKSSLLNALAGMDVAIVTEIAGTTRDVLRQQIQIDGIPLHIIDTAGLRDTLDPIEQEGVRRAHEEIQIADHILWIYDGQTDPRHASFDPSHIPVGVPVTFLRNKIDLTGDPEGITEAPSGFEVAISARTGAGLDVLRQHLKSACGFLGQVEGELLARRRHLNAIERTLKYLNGASNVLEETGATELAAEEMRQAQRALGEITGEFTSEELLGKIFSSFCIGK